MNAHPSDTAHALAHDAAGAMPARSVDAKTREDKATQDKGRHNKGTIGVAASHHVVGLGDVALRIGMMTIEAFQKAGYTERVVRDDLTPCWEFRGYTDPSGYGRVRGIAAHRLALLMEGVEIPEGHHVLHACDNPPCVNPQHLRPGTRSDNMRDMVAKGRHRYPLGDEHHRVKLTDEQVVAIRENYTGQRGEISRTAEAYGVRANQIAKILHGQARAAAGGKIHEPKWRQGGWRR